MYDNEGLLDISNDIKFHLLMSLLYSFSNTNESKSFSKDHYNFYAQNTTKYDKKTIDQLQSEWNEHRAPNPSRH